MSHRTWGSDQDGMALGSPQALIQLLEQALGLCGLEDCPARPSSALKESLLSGGYAHHALTPPPGSPWLFSDPAITMLVTWMRV